MKKLDLIQLFKDYGLEYNNETGGHYKKLDNTTVLKCNSDLYELRFNNSSNVLFLTPTMFMKTLTKTEKKLELKLFI